ncbi:hypothetical protein [Butyrivibrio sp. YAB3001]|uniref:hypothetical protein n=1 Tax=Butyrivibrio sp. YAB3001 TaxID=1520812 RepID=UPI0008F64A9C|nr:hypothetical protein [Butyrivibrio sp. YAB3001]SFC89930.1 hypothetical protein SAMN02910398_03454 [Butyrivibrio sp. YAB3001]
MGTDEGVMEELTGLGKTILGTDQDKIYLDLTVKNILAYKPLLARIFKEVVYECRDMSCEEIEKCIEGEVLVNSVFVDGGLTNAGERIDGLSTESYLNGEGLDRYDVRTYLRIPGDTETECIKLLINVEAQNEDKPGYDIPLRALFYCCRMISAQQGVEFTTDTDDPVKYGNIKKVYSIWLCTETAQCRANSIEKYDIKREFVVGSNSDDPRYDIMTAVIINISEKHDTQGSNNELIHLLTDLFDERIKGADKVVKLKDTYGLKLTREVESEVSEMCTYATAMENKGIEKGLKALVQSLKGYIGDFESLYAAVIKNEEYSKVTREQVMKYYR